MQKFQCSKCPNKLPASFFHLNGAGRRRSACKGCEARRDAIRKGYADGDLQRPKAPKAPPAPREADELLTEHKLGGKLKRTQEEVKRLTEALDLAQERNAVAEQLNELRPRVTIKAKKRGSDRREAVAVMMCSDWHVEEPVESEKVNGMNEYNLDIAEKRIDKLTEGFLWLLDMHRTKFDVNTAVVWLGGDLLTGYIHEELEESNQLSPVETVLWLQERIVRMLDTIMARGDLKKLVVPCSYGNHGRTGKKKRISTGAENSYEWMMYQQLKQWYKNDPRVEFIAPKSQLVYVDVYGFTVRFAHGDQVGYGGGVGGITIPVNKKVANWDVGKHADITCIGHFHQYLSLPHVVTNGSLIGFNPFAISIGARFEPPQQAFFLIDSKRGKTASYPIWVEDRAEQGDDGGAEVNRLAGKKYATRRS